MKYLPSMKVSFSLVGLFLILLANGCAPIFSEMQSARTVGKNNVDATASFSSVNLSNDGEREHLQNHVGFQAAYGLSDAVDLRIRYAYVWVDEDINDIRANVLGFGPKVSLVKDRLSVYLPIGFAFGSDFKENANWQIHPTLLGTIPIVDNFDFNPSVKVLVPIKESVTTVAFNLGLGIKLNENLTLRPEYGMLFDPGEEGSRKQFSIGATFTPPSRSDMR
jgi:hypothetical protein